MGKKGVSPKKWGAKNGIYSYLKIKKNDGSPKWGPSTWFPTTFSLLSHRDSPPCLFLSLRFLWRTKSPRHLLPPSPSSFYLAQTLFLSLPLSPTISLSLSSSLIHGGQATIWAHDGSTACTRWVNGARRCRAGWAQLSLRQNVVVGCGGRAWESWLHGVSPRFSGHPTSQSWCQIAQYTPLFKMVPFVPDKSAKIIDMYFCAITETLQVDLSQTEPYFDVTIPNSHS